MQYRKVSPDCETVAERPGLLKLSPNVIGTVENVSPIAPALRRHKSARPVNFIKTANRDFHR